MISERGYSKTTVRELAEAVDLSQTALLHYFGSKDGLFAEILRRRDADFQVVAAQLAAPTHLGQSVVDAVRANIGEPGFIQLVSRVSNEATEKDHVAHVYFGERYRRIRAIAADQIAQLDEGTGIDIGLTPEELAALIFAVIDGLQTQWLYDPSIDMVKVVDRFVNAIGITTERALVEPAPSS